MDDSKLKNKEMKKSGLVELADDALDAVSGGTGDTRVSSLYFRGHWFSVGKRILIGTRASCPCCHSTDNFVGPEAIVDAIYMIQPGGPIQQCLAEVDLTMCCCQGKHREDLRECEPLQ